MPKKNKDDVPNPNSVTNRDIIQRLNFLYQASVYLNGIASQSTASRAPSSSTRANGEQERNKRRPRKMTTSDLSRNYITSMKVVGQKTTVKIDPAVKRTLCKGCNVVLASGLTATVRTKKSSSHGHIVTYTCTGCKTSRHIPAPPTITSSVDLYSPSLEPQGTTQKMLSDSQPIYTSDHIMDIDTADANAISLQSSAPRSTARHVRKKKTLIPRLPPLFARNVGHVVFCGNQKLPQNEMDGENRI